MTRWLLLIGIVAVGLVAAGCGSGGPKQEPPVPVRGTVNLDGRPLSEGDIAFIGDPGSIPDVLHVSNGNFDGKVRPGKKRVEIRAYKLVKPPAGDTNSTGDSRENYLPSRFNDASTLQAEVTADGLHPDKFDTQSK